MSDLGSKLTKLAEGVLDELLTPYEGVKPSLDQRIDAIKVIGTLHLGLSKVAAASKDDDDDLGGASLPEMRARLMATANGGDKVEGE